MVRLFLRVVVCCSVYFSNTSFAMEVEEYQVTSNQGLRHITELSVLDSIDGDLKITAPHYILSETLYTTDMNVYAYGKYNIKIINKDNPDKLVLQITENLQPAELKLKKNDINVKLPWWSNSAPSMLRELDFSMVDGNSKTYPISDNYHLTAVAKQGAWGMVYVLERTAAESTGEKICAVKLLFTRTDKPGIVEDYRERHQQEIENNLYLASLGLDIAIKPYGIIENDQDHYLLFLEYGESASLRFKDQLLDTSIDQINDLLIESDKLHAAGYAHGDLKIDNVLLVNNKIKLCDWFSLSSFTDESVGKYRYIGDNLPPEALAAFYFRDNNALTYAKILDKDKEEMYILHPIATDRFCLAISFLEIIAPELYKNIYQTFIQLVAKGFNPYRPESLDFWPEYATCLKETHQELLLRGSKPNNLKKGQLFLKMARYIDVDPLNRK